MHYILLVLDGLDIKAKSRADDTGVLPIYLEHNCRLTRVVEAAVNLASVK